MIENRTLRTLTRLSLVCLFPPSALDKILDWPEAIKQASSGILPGAPALLTAAILVETVAPVMIVAEKRDREAALVLAAFCAATGLLYHPFWTYKDLAKQEGSKGRAQLWDFLKNFGLVGGLLLVAFDGRSRRRRLFR